ncbi:MAG: hypothetical protein U0694_17150 [Anaerolineae bacterium]
MLIVNGTIITWGTPNQILEQHAVLIKDGVIAAVAPQRDLLAQYPQEQTVDARGQLVMPGNICAHTHFTGRMRAAWPIPGRPAKLKFCGACGGRWTKR